MKAKRVVIEGGLLIDPKQGIEEPRCVVIEDDRVVGLPKRAPKVFALGAASRRSGDELRIDARGCWVLPGLIDLHAHLREPGAEYKETIASASAAAVAGGFTSLVAMPNTDPVNDSVNVTEFILSRAREAGLCRVLPAGAVTQGLKGEALSEMGLLAKAGCVLFTDDGRPVMAARLMRRALEYAKDLGLPVMVHEEDLQLSAGGAMHEGEVSTRLGLPGIPSLAEDVMVLRDIALLESCGGHLHFAHLSTAGSVAALREAKARGLRVSGEVTPHHFSLTDEAVVGYHSSTKMMPPLRSASDREALIKAMADGTLDAIATDHAPHAATEKDQEFDRAPNGVIGLETALSLTFKLILEGSLSRLRGIELLTAGPAAVLGLDRGSLAPGLLADLLVFDPKAHWRVEAKRLRSRSKNTPFMGMTLPGVVRRTLVGGRTVFLAEPQRQGGERP